jgi:hypothetical protein
METMTPSQALEQRIAEYRAQHPVSYEVAYRQVLRDDPALASAYARTDLPVPPQEPVSGSDVIRHDDLLRDNRDSYRREFSGAELGQKAAGDALHRFALEHQERHPSATYEEALAIVRRINPELVRAYAGLPGLSVEDGLRRAGAGTVVVQDAGGARYHLHNYQVKTPGLAGPKTAEEARDKLMALVRARMKQGPADAMLEVVTTKEGRALLDLVLQGDEPEGEE